MRHDGLADVAAGLAQHANDLSRRLVVAARVDDDRTSGLLLRVRTRLQHLPLVVCSQNYIACYMYFVVIVSILELSRNSSRVL